MLCVCVTPKSYINVNLIVQWMIAYLAMFQNQFWQRHHVSDVFVFDMLGFRALIFEAFLNGMNGICVDVMFSKHFFTTTNWFKSLSDCAVFFATHNEIRHSSACGRLLINRICHRNILRFFSSHQITLNSLLPAFWIWMSLTFFCIFFQCRWK